MQDCQLVLTCTSATTSTEVEEVAVEQVAFSVMEQLTLADELDFFAGCVQK